MAESAAIGSPTQTEGSWTHAGRLTVRRKTNTGTLLNVTLPDDMGIVADGSVTSAKIADGTIQTADLAPGAAQQQIGAYYANTTWSTTAAGWQATPVTSGSIACSGALCRVECVASVGHTNAGASVYVGLFFDGGLLAQYGFASVPFAGGYSMVPLIYYYAPAPANHTFTLYLYNAAGTGTISLRTDVAAALYVTEQRR